MKSVIQSYHSKTLLFLALCLLTTLIYSQEEAKYVNIDGFKYHVKLGGLDKLNQDTPVVVLEMGAGSTMKSWSPIFDELAKLAPVFAYERAGIGESEWNNIEPMPVNVVTQLRKILQELKLPPPYVLLGHSWGGVIIRAFAGNHKDEVKALVYVDPMDYLMTAEDERGVFSAIGADPDEAIKFIEDVTEFFTSGQGMPPGISAEYNAIEKYNKSDIPERGLGEEPNLPLAVFIGTKMRPAPPVPPQFKQPFEYEAWFRSSMKQRVGSLSQWPYEFSDEGYLFVSPKADHYFHFGEPQMVIDMVEKFVSYKN